MVIVKNIISITKYNLQEPIATPRRPVILKSDREIPKDQMKEKIEKEKQPTIILKTREQSTPKDERPVSPKSQTDIENLHPSKIAQNEKEKKGLF